MSTGRPLKILFITDNYPPEVNAPATRTAEHCKVWASKNAEVTVLTCAPNFPQGRVYAGYKNRLYTRETSDGITVIRVWSYITANEGFIRRTLDYLSFAISAFWAGLFRKTDIIVATSPQFFTTWAAAALSLLKRKPWVFELRDLWPESIKSVGAISDGLVYRTLEKAELFLYRNADHIIPNTEAFKENLINRGISAAKISVVPNGANLTLFKPRKPDPELVRMLGVEGKFVIGYIGTHGMAHTLDFVVRAISKLNNPNLFFLFIGDGAEKKKVKELAESLNLDNVRFLDPIPKTSMPDYLSLIDVSLAPLRKSDTFKTVIPSKIFEAAAMGKPVLLGVDGQARSIVEDYGSGLYFEPENTDDFLKKILILFSETDRYQELVEGSFALANAYNRDTFAVSMLDILNQTAIKSN